MLVLSQHVSLTCFDHEFRGLLVGVPLQSVSSLHHRQSLHVWDLASVTLPFSVCTGVPPQPLNFSSYINGESVRNQDLVNWVTVGAFDVPNSESAPVTSINGRTLSFWLLPYNYFDQVCMHWSSSYSMHTRLP